MRRMSMELPRRKWFGTLSIFILVIWEYSMALTCREGSMRGPRPELSLTQWIMYHPLQWKAKYLKSTIYGRHVMCMRSIMRMMIWSLPFAAWDLNPHHSCSIYLQIIDPPELNILPDLSAAMVGETICSFWELQLLAESSWWWKRLGILFPATQWIHTSLDLVWWRNSRLVGWRSDSEGPWSKEATKEFKILFSGIVYKATWKAMKKKAFIPLLCLPTFLHLRMRPKVYCFWSAIKRNQIFYMLFQYKLGNNFNLTFEENRTLLSSMNAKICFKMLLNHYSTISVTRGFNLKLTNMKVGLFYNHFLKY